MYKKIKYNSGQTDKNSIKTQAYQGFSLAELMIVMLVLTIILAATMPILSKRAKVKVAAVASSGSNAKWCTKVVNDYFETSSTSDVNFLIYIMYGGGGGGRSYYGSGGGGGSSAIFLNGVLQAYASGGSGNYSSNCGSPGCCTGQDGSITSGSLILRGGEKIKVYAGGGGGGAYNGGGAQSGAGAGAGGSGYYGGNAGSIYLSYGSCGGSGDGGTNTGGTTTLGGCGALSHGGNTSILGGVYALGGNAANGGSTSISSMTYGGGGGGYGGAGGNGGLNRGGTYPTLYPTAGNSATSTAGTGKGGQMCTDTTPATGGDGGSVTLLYITDSSTCPF